MSTAGNPSDPVPGRSDWPADWQSPPALGVDEQAALHHAMSHDLRAPLRVVEGFTRILKEDYGPQLDAQANQHLDRVLSAAERMNVMLDALLAQAQLTSEPLQRQAVDVSALAREVGREQLGVLNGAARAELVVADGLVAQADPALLRRVLENLIGNALKYSDKVACPQVSVGVMADTDPEVYFVCDNGAGFDMAHANKLFGMFQRLHSAKDFPGNGVGLAATQNIVRRHGGRIWAEAEVDRGACFYFTLDASRHHQRRTER
ncbi:sensor histidine kinase [Aquabacterium sp.]|uniref:sensor histidine kinase n=1 Tax=Aquabacterium sp. TaxID=1872578 RepID=UPI003D03373D